MKILILSKKFPYPLREGEPIAITYLSRSLVAQGCEVSILVMNTSKHYFDPAELPPDYNHFKAIHSVKVDNRITMGGALQSFVSGNSYILDRFVSVRFEQKLRELLVENDYDIVQLETPYLTHYVPTIRQFSKAKIAMRAHNVEHKIWERVAELTKNPLKSWYLKNQNAHLKTFELENLNAYDIMVSITDRDMEAFRKLGFKNQGVVAPVGIDLQEYKTEIKGGEVKSIGFIGALDWMPNQNGLIWFLENVWPGLSQKFPELEFHVAGKNTPNWLRKKAIERAVFRGEVPDAKAFIREHPIFVAPLFSGSGIKIKVLEGMALGRAVMTTPVGAEGINALPAKEFVLAETPEDFRRKITELIKNRPLIPKLGKAARRFIQFNFDNLEIGARVKAAYQKSLSRT